ncbi:glycosyltransferase involved in cell wall biosynthesis [Sphingobacterium paludis]|uniref:Glycosyltransferase involved in cell wall biosynthesis n=1 Tax=Sphingobacterium paludis TaxID=1476465 RepID=A0A4R7CUH8_9SPHI|nr:glycosyltransferase involved in cell wall biosynthesis [Sphingobacterium paludis]
MLLLVFLLLNLYKHVKLSIVTINLNNRKGLQKTFNSILMQSFQQFEYIVVDGLSSDGSREDIKSNNRINKCICEIDTGVYDAMNKGIAIASGEYVLFLNSGDILHDDDTLSGILKHLEHFDIIYGDLLFVSADKPYVYNYPAKLTFSFLLNASLGHPATFIKKSLFDKYGYYDTSFRIAADWVFFMKTIVKENVTTKHIPMVIADFDTDGLSSQVENIAAILTERKLFLEREFPLFLEDYEKIAEATERLKKIQSNKAFKLLRALGVKKFQ